MRNRNNQSGNKPSIFSLLIPYKGMIILLVIFALAASLVNLILPGIIANGIDDFEKGNFILKEITFQFAFASFIIFIFTYLQSIVQTVVSEKVARNIRNELAAKISNQTFSWIQQANPAKLLTNLTSDIDSIKMFVGQAVVSIISSVFVIVGACILLFAADWKLALAVVTIIPVIGSAFYIIMRKVRPLFKQSREVIDRLNRVINESILGAAIIRVINSQHIEYQKFIEASTDARNLGLSILRLFATLIPIINFTANLAILTVLALGGHFVMTGDMTIGGLAAFNSYITILIFPIIIIGFMSNIVAQASVSWNRISLVLNAPGSVEEGQFAGAITGNIELRNIYLSFKGKPILKDINLSVKAGSRIAVIGPTAAGKTQLLNLLTGLFSPDSGSIEIDDKPIKHYNKEYFHSQIGYVFQDSIMFNMSLAENIAFSRDVPDNLFQKAIETAGLSEFINNLPKKMYTIVSERGTSLSGGQKQRIMLARALAMAPKILLLDDFTARVDKKTEQMILRNLQDNYTEITLISVTQQIEPIKDFDQIILLMEGEMIASGKHQSLLESCLEYVQIYNSQQSTSHYEL